MFPTTFRINDEHAELLGLALADIRHSIDQLVTSGVIAKKERTALTMQIDELVREASGDPMSRVEVEEYERFFEKISE